MSEQQDPKRDSQLQNLNKDRVLESILSELKLGIPTEKISLLLTVGFSREQLIKSIVTRLEKTVAREVSLADIVPAFEMQYLAIGSQAEKSAETYATKLNQAIFLFCQSLDDALEDGSLAFKDVNAIFFASIHKMFIRLKVDQTAGLKELLRLPIQQGGQELSLEEWSQYLGK